MSAENPHLTVILPTRNESAGIIEGLTQLEAALVAHGIDAEILVVDDSDDATPQLVREHAASLPLRVAHRSPSERTGGLAGAVTLGFSLARGQYVSVMDADLQHPPGHLALMLAQAEKGIHVVVASRYVPGGSAAGLGTPSRKLVSHVSRWLAIGLFRGRLQGLRDPLSGFFLIERSVVAGAELRPHGFKILLEVLLRGHWQTCAEVPYRFQARRIGMSKATFDQGRAYIDQLVMLLLDQARGRLPVPAHSQPRPTATLKPTDQ